MTIEYHFIKLFPTSSISYLRTYLSTELGTTQLRLVFVYFYLNYLYQNFNRLKEGRKLIPQKIFLFHVRNDFQFMLSAIEWPARFSNECWIIFVNMRSHTAIVYVHLNILLLSYSTQLFAEKQTVRINFLEKLLTPVCSEPAHHGKDAWK